MISRASAAEHQGLRLVTVGRGPRPRPTTAGQGSLAPAG